MDNPLQTLQEQQQPKQLFDELSMSDENPFENLELSSEAHHQVQNEVNEVQEKSDEEAVDFRAMMKQSKKQKKQAKKMSKKKSAKAKKDNYKQNRDQNIIQSNKKPVKKMMLDSEDDQQPQNQPKQNPQSKPLKKKSAKKASKHSDQQNIEQADMQDQSDQYSSQQQLSQSQKQQLDNLNPDQQGRKFKKKLGKKARKQRILEKEGFDLKELGNDGDVNYDLNGSEGESGSDYSEGGRKKKKGKKGNKESNKKEKKEKLTNEQLLDQLQKLGCQQQLDQSARYNYDSGLQELAKLRPKKQSKNKIKVQNKLFGDLQMELQKQLQQEENLEQNAEQVPTQKLQLQFKPRVSTSKAATFLNRVQTLKKHRGLQSNVSQEQFDMISKQKAKRSISQLASRIQNQIQDNEQIDIEIKAPTISKGKSADLINNTMFIVKQLSQKQGSNGNEINGQQEQSTEMKPVEKKPAGNEFHVQPKSKKGVSREDFFKQIKESISVRRSKYVSAQQLKNSFKQSKLQQLQEIRKKAEQKRRKQAMYELGQVQDDDAENVINQLEEQLAKKGGMSRAELKKLLRVEEGLEELDDYDDKVGQQKKDIKQGKEGNSQLNNKQGKGAQSQIVSIQPITKPHPLELLKPTLIPKPQQQQPQHQPNIHADDMIDQYEGQQQNIDQEEMADEENQEEEGENDQEDGEEEQYDQEEIEQQGNEENELKQDININENDHNNVDQNVRQQLQEQGIIMPGIKGKKRTQQPNTMPKTQDPIHQNPTQISKYLIDNSVPQPQPQTPQQPQTQTLQFTQFKKLRKIAVVIQQKKQRRQEQLQRAKQFFEQQAELGSDNEDNDDHVKAINKKDDAEEEDGDHLDQQLQELIDNAVDINEENEQEAFRKYMEDVKQKDREELQRILRGEFRRPNHDMPDMEVQDDDRERIERMEKMVEWMKRREEDEKGMYAEDDQREEINYYIDKNGNRRKIQTKKKHAVEDLEDTPQEDQHIVEQKLQYYLMDNISPAKMDDQVEDLAVDFIKELPTAMKKPTVSVSSFLSKKSSTPAQNTQPKGNLFSGSLLNLANKSSSNESFIPKMKKTSSHMAEYLNKHKSHIAKSSNANGASMKLPAIFGRVVSKK